MHSISTEKQRQISYPVRGVSRVHLLLLALDYSDQLRPMHGCTCGNGVTHFKRVAMVAVGLGLRRMDIGVLGAPSSAEGNSQAFSLCKLILFVLCGSFFIRYRAPRSRKERC